MAKKDDTNKIITIVLAIVICLAAIVIIFVNLPQDSTIIEDNNDDTTDELEEDILLTIIYGDTTHEYNMTALKLPKPTSGSGRYIKTQLLPDDVVIKGPWTYGGITVSQLLNYFEDKPDDYNISVTSSDGWGTTYTKDAVNGMVNIYNETGNITDEGTVTMIIAYSDDSGPISEDDGGPLKIVFVGNGEITESNLWSKWVTTIEIVEV